MNGIERLRKLTDATLGHVRVASVTHYYEDENDVEWDERMHLSELLASIYSQINREQDAMVEDSPYEALPPEDREAIAWVCEHGGLSHVKDIYHDLRAVVERLGIEWSESELHVLMDILDRRLMPEGCDWEFLKLHMSNLRGFMLDVMDRLGVDKSDSDAPEIAFDALDRRIMPEGMEWPRYESGEPVPLVGAVADGLGHAHEVTSIEFCKGEVALHWNPDEPEECVWVGHGARVRRPAVLAADGEPLEAGQTVWRDDGEMLEVLYLRPDGLVDCCGEIERPERLTHQRPVLDADGVPIKKRDTVYLLPGEWCDEFPCLGFHGGEELEVFADGEAGHVPGSVQCREREKKVGIRGTCYPQPSQLTHAKPEPPDSAERIADDIRRMAEGWCSHPTLREASEMAANAVGEATMGVALINLFKRCKALAERERGE